MNKKIIFVFLLLCAAVFGYAQETPQFAFNSSSDLDEELSVLQSDYEKYLALKLELLLFKDKLDTKEVLKHYRRMYEIEHASVIRYTTISDSLLPFLSQEFSSKSGTPVEFGSPLRKQSVKENGTIMWFDAPVTKIDPALFAPDVTGIQLPSSTNLNYSSSPTICVTNLKQITGKDVVNNHALVSKDGTLIVAAVAGVDAYKIPVSVVKIGDGALRGSTINHVIIPKNVMEIGQAAFDLCKNLKTITILSTEPIQINNQAFGSDKHLKFKIYVPETCYRDYCNKYPSLKKRIKKMKNLNYLTGVKMVG